MKKNFAYIVPAILLSSVLACDNDLPLSPYGRIEIRCSINSDSPAINVDGIKQAKVFLTQYRQPKEEANLIIDEDARTGSYLFTNVHTGSYEVSVMLGLQDEKFDFVSESNLTINYGDNGIKYMPEFEDINGFLHFKSEWYTDISGIDSVIVALVDNSEPLPEPARTYCEPTPLPNIDDRFDSLYPGSYTWSTIINGVQPTLPPNIANIASSLNDLRIHHGENLLIIRGPNPKITRIDFEVEFHNELVPRITSGPFVSYYSNPNGSDRRAVITWATDRNATSNVCYSREEDFDRNDLQSWAPTIYDDTANTTDHRVDILNLDVATPLYFVVVTSDGQGRQIISAEAKIPKIAKVCADEIIAGRPDIPIQYAKDGWNVDPANNLNIILNWSTVDIDGFWKEWAKYECCYAN